MLLEATQFWVLCHGSPRKRVPPKQRALGNCHPELAQMPR